LSLAVAPSGELYVGGAFGQAGGAPAINVARWTGSVWQPLDTGIGITGAQDMVHALLVSAEGVPYAGGVFTQASGQPANRMVRWNGSQWEALGPGVGAYENNSVLALVAFGDVRHASGSFDQAGGQLSVGAAMWLPKDVFADGFESD
jgi:hypothetical protein